jgi:hypothetical protein
MNIEKLYNKILKEDGFTIDNKLKEIIDDGFFVSIPGDEIIIPINKLTFELFKNIINSYTKQNLLIGCWNDNKNIFFDSSIHVKNKNEAIYLGFRWKQLAIFDNKLKITIRLNYI